MMIRYLDPINGGVKQQQQCIIEFPKNVPLIK